MRGCRWLEDRHIELVRRHRGVLRATDANAAACHLLAAEGQHERVYRSLDALGRHDARALELSQLRAVRFHVEPTFFRTVTLPFRRACARME